MYILAEMSTEFKNIRLELRSHYSEMLRHLLKLYYFYNTQIWEENKLQWYETCWKGWDDIPRDACNNKFPKFDKLYNAVWKERENNFNDVSLNSAIHSVNYELANIKNNKLPYIDENLVNLNDMKTLTETYLCELCKLASKNGKVLPEENNIILDNLLKEYHKEN